MLSQFCGRRGSFAPHFFINPSDVDKSADVLVEALGMSVAEQSERMRLLHDNVATFDALWWTGQLVEDAIPNYDCLPAVP